MGTWSLKSQVTSPIFGSDREMKITGSFILLKQGMIRAGWGSCILDYGTRRRSKLRCSSVTVLVFSHWWGFGEGPRRSAGCLRTGQYQLLCCIHVYGVLLLWFCWQKHIRRIVLLKGSLKANGSGKHLDHRPTLCIDGQEKIRPQWSTSPSDMIALSDFWTGGTGHSGTVYCCLLRKNCISRCSG